MKALGLQVIKIAEIDDRVRLRPIDPAYVDFLAENIEQVGQLRSPIEIRTVKKPGPFKFKLVAGGHRLAAMRQLERLEIDSFVFEMTDTEAELAEVDENLVRHDLNPLDRAVFLHRRKALYEALHPETKQGGDRGNQHTGGKERQNDIMSFSRATAEKVGLNERSIQRAILIATRLAPDVKAQIVGTSLARNQAELLALVKLPPEEQRKVVAELLAETPRAKSVSAAHRLVLGGQVEEADPDSAKFAQLVTLWGRSGDKARRMFLAHLKQEGDLKKFSQPAKVRGADAEDEAA
ncbi:ParB/RepB/Spo0J family partition protein [Niveispirillum cyanobacteriorum]|uniref:Chromosome partitioning protein ParB n=1 Tax=Niveispirillum cyanobacteriorum TaxID=1612173 RepID=A0A2K9NGB2_9PROT|nr:ParB/RepB/Spo0J family partition protein [Niveispirillum cyanobacteriorum]AUN31275.1 chromosome partitioning protein ParB [Niveispirillum cyanobacteriorum]GGE72707.1 hypothetical protein GCM10011317_32460 [Niveispirillum cyanobacteriorum]